MNFLLQSNETFQKGNARILYSNTNICELVHRIKRKIEFLHCHPILG